MRGSTTRSSTKKILACCSATPRRTLTPSSTVFAPRVQQAPRSDVAMTHLRPSVAFSSAADTDAALETGRATCYACHRPVGHCYCADIPLVDNQTEIVILQHPRERFHPIGTARIASLGLNKVRVEIDHAHALRNGERSLDLAPGCGLLYPGPSSRDLATLPPAEHPRQIVVIDGTWHHAHTMFRDIPGLAKLPRYRLTPPKPSQYRIRREPARDYVSTVEAIVYCLKLIE